jgi:rhomboid protease GluP
MRDGSFGLDVDAQILLNLGASMRYFVQGGEYWRLATAVFLHANWIHLLVNTVFMFRWCVEIEKTVGSTRFAIAYLTTGTAGYAASVLCKSTMSVGASGAGFGMIAVTLGILYRRMGSWETFISNPFVRSTVSQAAFWILAGILLIRRMDNYAHVGGLVFGILCGLIVERRSVRRDLGWVLSWSAYLLVWAGIVVAACVPGWGVTDR